MCSIMALWHDGLSFGPYFQNRFCEVLEHFKALEQLTDTLHPMQWVLGHLNPVDVLTKPSGSP